MVTEEEIPLYACVPPGSFCRHASFLVAQRHSQNSVRRGHFRVDILARIISNVSFKTGGYYQGRAGSLRTYSVRQEDKSDLEGVIMIFVGECS